jgi:polar amino acid transport system substrate-binding protein
MRILRALALLLSGWTVLTCQAAPADMQLVLSNQEYPPYLGQNIAGYGLMSRVVTEAFRREKISVRYVFFPNNRTLQSARSGMVDGSLGWALTTERQQDLVFSDPVMSLNMVFFQRAGPQLTWRHLSDLKSYRIGITAGNTYSDEFARLQRSHVLHTEAVADDVTNFRKLLAHHIDLFPIDSEVGALELAQHFSPEQRQKLQAQGTAFWTADMRVVVWRGRPDAAELIRRFNRGLKQLRASGEFARLVEQTRREIAAQGINP